MATPIKLRYESDPKTPAIFTGWVHFDDGSKIKAADCARDHDLSKLPVEHEVGTTTRPIGIDIAPRSSPRRFTGL